MVGLVFPSSRKTTTNLNEGQKFLFLDTTCKKNDIFVMYKQYFYKFVVSLRLTFLFFTGNNVVCFSFVHGRTTLCRKI